jgi:RNA polymerase sigma factor (sigma-70 family)
VEASALRAPPTIGRLSLGLPLLRVRSDEQLLALFRSGNEDAFGVIHDRYRQRLFAYVRQMLSACSRQDAEDVMQDVFVRAYGALRADRREVNLRAWLYRVAHNRCVDHLRRPAPAPAEVFELSRKPLYDPLEEAQRREDLARLVEDVGRLPEQQRSALLMREIDGMSYAHLADALEVTVPAVKSLLVRARIGLVEAAEARDADCADIRQDLAASYDRGVKASGRARRHLRTCQACTEYRAALRGIRASFAALSPVAAGPLAFGAKLLGLGGAGGGAAAGGSAAAGGGAAATGGVATVSACKVAAAVCTAALTAGGAVEVSRIADRDRGEPPPTRVTQAVAPAPAARDAAVRGSDAAPVTGALASRRPMLGYATPERADKGRETARERAGRSDAAAVDEPIAAPPPPLYPVMDADGQAPAAAGEDAAAKTGGVQAPDPEEPLTAEPVAETAPAPPAGEEAPPTERFAPPTAPAAPQAGAPTTPAAQDATGGAAPAPPR